MNIFATDPCPRISAQNLDDKRVSKMVLETAQMLSAAILIRVSETGEVKPSGLYRKTHVNHPCTVWTRSGRQQFDWMIEHGLWLNDEFMYRYGHSLPHRSTTVIDEAAKHRGLFDETRPLLFDFNSSGFHEIAPLPMLPQDSVHYNYQLCMSHKWCYKDARRPTWTKRIRPKFYGLINRTEI